MINGVLVITLGIVKARVRVITCIMLIGLNRINYLVNIFLFSRGSYFLVLLRKRSKVLVILSIFFADG